ncbi:enoyl-CoA hydratase-related protein [Chloroflexota bacterium]
MREFKTIIYEPGRVARIIKNRPEKRNAISHIMYGELEAAFDDAAADSKCRVIILSGAGPAFSAGHDIVLSSPEAFSMADGTLRGEVPEGMPHDEAVQYLRTQPKYWKEHYEYFASSMKLNKWRAIPKVTIAMVHGYCVYGGFFNAAAMDLIFASEDALFLGPVGEYDVGAFDFGARKYKELLFEHRALPAREAQEIGFVSRIYPDRDILEKETLAFANRVADSTTAQYCQRAKEMINNTMDMMGFSTSVKVADLVFRAPQYSLLHEEQGAKGKEAEAHRAENEARGERGVAQAHLAVENLKAKLEAERKYYGK